MAHIITIHFNMCLEYLVIKVQTEMNKRKPLLLAEKPYTIYCIYVENILQLKIQIKQQQTTCLKMFGQKFKKLNFSGTLLNVIIKNTL